MKLIVGLGNPGEKYEGTRHNLGFRVVERFFHDFEKLDKTEWKESSRLKSKIAEIEWKPKSGPLEKVLLALPQTFMNNSGMAVSLISSFYKIDSENIWVVYDELDLPLGAMRIRFGGAAAGHHGVESIIDSLGGDSFWRFRLGIGISRPHSGRDAKDHGLNPKLGRQFLGQVDDYVLSHFGGGESNKVRELVKHASEAIEYGLEKGLEKSMNKFNTK